MGQVNRERPIHGLFMKRTKACSKLLLALAVSLAAGGCAARSALDAEPLSPDERITAEVLRIIAEEEEVVGEDLHIETRDGVVVISGVQPEGAPLGELLRRISRVRDVAEVVNRVRILR